MSKNITIQEGGIAKQLTVDKLKTNLVGGGTCLWVPEDETTLGTKIITENGTYKASDDGYYGYSEVTVNIPNAGTATGTDGDGDEAVAHTDPETGELVTDKVPSSIEVITPPTNPYGIYTDGQSISPDGMAVKAYLASGGEYGTVPNGEITLSPTTATYDASTDTLGGGKASSELEDSKIPFVREICAVPLRQQFPNMYYSGPITNVGNAVLHISCSGSTYAFECSKLTINGTPTIVIASKEPANGTVGFGEFTGDNMTGGGSLRRENYTYNNKTVYYSVLTGKGSGEDGTARSAATAAWTIVYGTKTDEYGAGSHQTITVSWPRPLDGKVLETTFEILVAPPYSTEE